MTMNYISLLFRRFRLGCFTCAMFGAALAVQAAAPTVTIPVANPTINDTSSGSTIFSAVTIGDDDTGASLIVKITFNDNKGDFLGNDFMTSGPAATRVLTIKPTAGQSVANALSDLQALQFAPSENQVAAGSSENLSFEIEVDDGTTEVSDTLTLVVNSVNDAPELTLPATNPSINDTSSGSSIFSGVSIDDDDTSAEVDVIVTYDNTKGAFTAASLTSSGFVQTNSTTLTFAPTVGVDASAAQTALRALSFDPVPNQVAVGSSEVLGFNIELDDGTDQVDDDLSVTVVSINDTPEVTTGSNRAMDDDETLTIFSGVTFTDDDVSDLMEVVITYNLNKGSFTSGDSPFDKTGSGSGATLTLNPTLSRSAAEAAIQALVFTPEPNQVIVDDDETLSFSIELSDVADDSDTESLNVVVTSVNDTPVLDNTGGDSSQFTISAGGAKLVFPQISLIDPDIEDTSDPDPEQSGDDFIAEITLSGGATPGSIDLPAFTPSGANTYSYTGKRSEVVQALREFDYIAPGVAGVFTISVTVTDVEGAESAAQTRNANVIQPNPGVTGLLEGQQVADNGLISPFAFAIFNSFGSESRVVEISLDDNAKGVLTILGDFSPVVVDSKLIYRMTGSAVAATNSIQNLRFEPTENRIVKPVSGPFSEDTVFTISVRDVSATSTDPDLSTDVLSVTVLPQNDDPFISTSNPQIDIDDNETATPFSTISLLDLDEDGTQNVTVIVTMSAPAAGVPGLLTSTDAGFVAGAAANSYTFSGTPTEATAILQGLVFDPTDNRITVGQQETVSFTIEMDDGEGGTAQNGGTSVTVTSINGAPEINGVPALSEQPFAVPSTGPDQTEPFLGVSVFDKEDLTVEVTLSSPDKGTLALSASDQAIADDAGDLSLTVNFDTVAGTYQLIGTPDAITTALSGFVYTLTPVLTDPSSQIFYISATDGVSSAPVEQFEIFIRDRNVAHIVTTLADSGAGSLREAVGLAGHGDFVVFDFAVDVYPATIYLQDTLLVSKDLTVVGSGVSDLTISGAPDAESDGAVGIFYVSGGATLTLEQLTLKDGNAASYGGAVAVEGMSKLVARYCSFEGNQAGQTGGAIDIYESDLLVEQCLFLGNSVVGSTARAGGAISIETVGESSIVNSTFVENRQDNNGGIGGGAIHAKNFDVSDFFDLSVEHCTFLNNSDVSNNNNPSGTAILSSTLSMRVHLRNNIFADEQGVVLDVIGGGRFISMGKNIATDATTTTYTQGSQHVTLLDHGTDMHSVTDTGLLPLAENGGPTLTCALDAGSIALDAADVTSPAVATAVVLDQKGAWRDATPDIGAFEVDSFARVNINEIHVDPDTGDDQFIEFYNPRESELLNLQDLVLFIDDTEIETFGNTPIDPGAGHVWTTTTPVLDQEQGTIELRNSVGQTFLAVSYMASFVESGADTGDDHESITRYPRFEGGLLPHRRVYSRLGPLPSLPDGLTSAGNDVTGAPLNGGNAPPIAVADDEGYAILATEFFSPDILANDFEFDRPDTLKIEEVMTVDAGVVINEELLALDASTNGEMTLVGFPVASTSTVDSPASLADTAAVLVEVSADGQTLTYDPRDSDVMIALSEGQTKTDIWGYTILDYETANLSVARSRGADLAEQKSNIEKATTFFTVTVTGVNEAPEPDDDSIATFENQAIRMLSDVTLLNSSFDFGDLDANFKDNDAEGVEQTLKPPSPTLALLDNDDDVDNDNSNLDILLVAVHQTEAHVDLRETTSLRGARVFLDVRAEREETSILYDPRGSEELNALSAGELAEDSFYYTVIDRHGAQGVAKVTIQVTGVNDVPTAQDDDGFIANEDTSLEIAGSDLLENDTDPDMNDSGDEDAPIISIADFPTESDGGATLGFDGTTITYDPRTMNLYESLARNESISDTFTYVIDDENLGTSEATVTVVVEGRNDAPVTDDDTLDILENVKIIVPSVSGLMSNDVDVDINGSTPDDSPWVLPQRDVITPLGAGLNINTNGSYSYDANSAAIDSLYEGEIAVETFDYTVVDNFRTTSMDDAFKVAANMTVASSPTSISAYSADGDDAGIVVIENLNHQLTDGQLIQIQDYDGSADYNGLHLITVIDEDHFSVPVAFVAEGEVNLGSWRPWLFALPILGNDVVVGSESSDVTTYSGDAVTLIIESANHALRNDQLIVIDGYVGTGDYNGVYAVTAIDRDHFSVPIPFVDDPAGTRGAWTPWVELSDVTEADQGGFLYSPDGQQLLYTPATGFYGVETFSYTIEDGIGGQDVAFVTVEVIQSPLNGFLSASDDHFLVGMGTSDVEVDVLANDHNLPELGSDLSIVDFDLVGSDGGALTQDGQTLSYTPSSPSYTGTDTFEYTVSGGGTSTAMATIRFVVVDRTDMISGNDDKFVAVENTTNTLLDVLANDPLLPTFSVGLSLVDVVSSTTTAGGTVSVDGGQVSYTPPASLLGADSFEYILRDASGATTTQLVEVQVEANEVDFFAQDDHFTVVAGSGPVQLDVLFNDAAVQGNTSALRVLNFGLGDDSPPDVSRVSIGGGATSIVYTPPLSAKTESFNYEIGFLNSDLEPKEAKITIVVVDAFETAPNPQPDVYQIARDSEVHTLDVLANDAPYPVAGWQWTIDSIDTTGLSGSVLPVGDNALSYEPAEGFFGSETFTYTVIDTFGATADTTVTVHVGDLCTSIDRFAVLGNSIGNTLDVLANDDLLHRYANDYEISAVDAIGSLGGAVTIEGMGSNNRLSYTPVAGVFGEESFDYEVVDQTGNTKLGTVTVLILDPLSDRDSSELEVTITGVNDIPVLTGTADDSTTDKLAISPFPNVSITDLDETGLQLQEVIVSYDASFGSLSAVGFTMTSNGVYRILDTPAAVTAALNAMVFTPYENFIDYIDYGLDNSIGDVAFTLSIDDYNLSISDGPDAPIVDVTTINVEPINDAPTLVSGYSDWVLPVNTLPRARMLASHFADVDDDIAANELAWTGTSDNPSLFDSISVDTAKQLLVIDFATDQFGVAEVTVRATDRGGLLVETSFMVTIQGPHVTELAQPERADYVGEGPDGFFDFRYNQSFRVTNDGPLPAEAFIVHLSDFNIVSLQLMKAEYSSDENGSLDNFNDDTRSSDGVTILEVSPRVYSVKYDLPLEAGESTVVHFEYQIGFQNFTTVRPIVEIQWARASGTGMEMLIDTREDTETGELELTFVTEAGRTYQLEYSSDLSNWSVWNQPIPVSEFDTTLSVIDDGHNTDIHPSLVPSRFYRLVEIILP